MRIKRCFIQKDCFFISLWVGFFRKFPRQTRLGSIILSGSGYSKCPCYLPSPTLRTDHQKKVLERRKQSPFNSDLNRRPNDVCSASLSFSLSSSSLSALTWAMSSVGNDLSFDSSPARINKAETLRGWGDMNSRAPSLQISPGVESPATTGSTHKASFM